VLWIRSGHFGRTDILIKFQNTFQNIDSSDNFDIDEKNKKNVNWTEKKFPRNFSFSIVCKCLGKNRIQIWIGIRMESPIRIGINPQSKELARGPSEIVSAF
jgi:hypothetical protein